MPSHSPTLTKDELSQLNAGIQDWIVKLSNYLDTSVAAQSLPIIGKLVEFIRTEKGELTHFGSTLSNILTKAIGSNTVPTLSDVSKLINDGFKTAGIHASLNISGDANAVRVNLDAGVSGTYNQTLATNLGLGSIVTLNTSGTLKAGAGIDLKLTCGVDGNGFYIDTNRNTYTLPGGTKTLLSGTALSLSTDDSLGDLKAAAKLGSLAGQVSTSKNSSLHAKIDLNLGTTLAGGILKVNDLTNLGNIVVTPAVTGKLDLDLNVATSIQKTVNKETVNLLPLTSDESIKWDFATQSSPDISLKNTTVALGPVFQSGGLIASILSSVATCASAVDPVVQAMNKDIPGLPNSSFLALVASSQDLTSEQKQDITNFVTLIQHASSFLKDLPTVDPHATMRLPDFQVSGISSAPLPYQSPDAPAAEEPALVEKETALPIISHSVSDFLSKISLGSLGTLKLPILSDPLSIANLILGKETNLIQWDLPSISTSFNTGIDPFQPIPLVPATLAAGVTGSFTENLGIGYDSRGLIDLQKPENKNNPYALLDGIYLYNPQSLSSLSGPVLTANMTVTPELALGVGSLLSASVSGSIALDGQVLIHPDSLGNFHPFVNGTTDSLAPAFATARLSGGIKASATLAGISKEIDVVPNTVLFQTQFPSNSLQLGPALSLEGGNLRLNIGVNSTLSGNFDHPQGGDTLKLTHFKGKAGHEQLGLSINGSPNVLYNATKSLVGQASSGPLTILDQKNSLGQLVITPIVFDGGNSNLTFQGGSANDTLQLGDGDNKITPGTGTKNYIQVGNGENVIHLGLGKSTVSGGIHTTASYDLVLKSPVSVNLTTGSLGGAAAGDHLSGVPNISGTYLGDTLVGGASAGTLTGAKGNDSITAGSGGATLVGVQPGSASPGRREIDTLTGGLGNDLFVLGDASDVYYTSGTSRGEGKGDYALIRQFDPSHDHIQLKGASSQYFETLLTMNGQQGMGVYYNTQGGESLPQNSELIALVEPDASHTLSSLANVVQNARFI